MASATAIVTDILNDLQDRQGFDAFWDEMFPDVRDELIESLENTVREHLVGHQPTDQTPNWLDKVIIERSADGLQLRNVYAVSEGGHKIKMLITGVQYQHEPHSPGQALLSLNSNRVQFVDREND